jgi:hypothetical protein
VLDLAQARLALAMPTSGPADGMNDGDIARVAADQPGGQLARSLEQRQLLAGCRLSQAPMGVQFVMAFACLWIGPSPTGAHDNGGAAEDLLQLVAGRCWIGVKLDREDGALDDVGLGGAAAVAEGGERRAEHHGFASVRRLPRHPLGDIDQAGEIAVERQRHDLEGLAAAFVKRPQRDVAGRGVAKQRFAENLDLVAIGNEHDSLRRSERNFVVHLFCGDFLLGLLCCDLPLD